MVDKRLGGLAAMREVRKTERYDRWFRRLRDEQAKARITARIFAIASDHLGDAKGVGDGVLEARIMGKGPGYRLYFIWVWLFHDDAPPEMTRSAGLPG